MLQDMIHMLYRKPLTFRWAIYPFHSPLAHTSASTQKPRGMQTATASPSYTHCPLCSNGGHSSAAPPKPSGGDDLLHWISSHHHIVHMANWPLVVGVAVI